jgi:hypothetical protein
MEKLTSLDSKNQQTKGRLVTIKWERRSVKERSGKFALGRIP